jgi:hypothetical protein
LWFSSNAAQEIINFQRAPTTAPAIIRTTRLTAEVLIAFYTLHNKATMPPKKKGSPNKKKKQKGKQEEKKEPKPKLNRKDLSKFDG